MPLLTITWTLRYWWRSSRNTLFLPLGVAHSSSWAYFVACCTLFVSSLFICNCCPVMLLKAWTTDSWNFFCCRSSFSCANIALVFYHVFLWLNSKTSAQPLGIKLYSNKSCCPGNQKISNLKQLANHQMQQKCCRAADGDFYGHLGEITNLIVQL